MLPWSSSACVFELLSYYLCFSLSGWCLACCGGVASSAGLVGDAGVADQRFAAGWDRGGRGFSIVLAGRWFLIGRGSSGDVNGNEAGGGELVQGNGLDSCACPDPLRGDEEGRGRKRGGRGERGSRGNSCVRFMCCACCIWGACLHSSVLQSRQLCIGVLTMTIVVLTTVVMLAKAGAVAAVSIKMRTVRTTVTLATRTVTVW